MYESPVNLIFQDIERQIVQKQEQMIDDLDTIFGKVNEEVNADED